MIHPEECCGLSNTVQDVMEGRRQFPVTRPKQTCSDYHCASGECISKDRVCDRLVRNVLWFILCIYY